MADYIKYRNQGATRNRPLDDDLINRLAYLQDMGITMEVFSGGQPSKDEGGARVGSVRHDHGGAADAFFYKDGRRLDWANKDDLPIFQDIVSKGKQNGVTGFGAGPGYMQAGSMHIGGGKPGVWGAGGKGENAPGWLSAAYNGTKYEPVDPVAEVVAAGPSKPPELPAVQADPQLQAQATAKPDERGIGQKIFDRVLGTETPEQAKASVLPKLLPDEFMGINTKKGINLLGALATTVGNSDQTSELNKQAQQAAQAGQARRGQAQPVQVSMMNSQTEGNNGDAGGIAPLAKMTPQQLMELLKKQKMGGLGGLGGYRV